MYQDNFPYKSAGSLPLFNTFHKENPITLIDDYRSEKGDLLGVLKSTNKEATSHRYLRVFDPVTKKNQKAQITKVDGKSSSMDGMKVILVKE